MHLKDLPAIGQPLEGGTFAGLTTAANGSHCAVVLLADRPSSLLNWTAAMTWSASVNGELPTRPVSALLFMHLHAQFETDDEPWHWTSEQYSDRSAWLQFFDYGSQGYGGKSAELRARAVRLIQLTA